MSKCKTLTLSDIRPVKERVIHIVTGAEGIKLIEDACKKEFDRAHDKM